MGSTAPVINLSTCPSGQVAVSSIFWSLACPNMHIAPAYAPFPVADDNITTFVAEDSMHIITLPVV